MPVVVVVDDVTLMSVDVVTRVGLSAIRVHLLLPWQCFTMADVTDVRRHDDVEVVLSPSLTVLVEKW